VDLVTFGFGFDDI